MPCQSKSSYRPIHFPPNKTVLFFDSDSRSSWFRPWQRGIWISDLLQLINQHKRRINYQFNYQIFSGGGSGRGTFQVLTIAFHFVRLGEKLQHIPYHTLSRRNPNANYNRSPIQFNKHNSKKIEQISVSFKYMTKS